jgi:hypothetical protein
LKPSERKAIDKAIRFLRTNPRHPSLNVHKAKNVKGKYVEGGNDIFIAYASKNLRFTPLESPIIYAGDGMNRKH